MDRKSDSSRVFLKQVAHPNSRLRIAVLTDGGSLYSPAILMHLLADPELDVSEVFVRHKEGISSISKHVISRSGYRYLFERAIGVYKLKVIDYISKYALNHPLHSRPLPRLVEVAKHYSVPLISIRDVNEEDTYRSIASKKYDVVLSIFYGQIIRPDALFALNESVLINLHPSILPKYAGMNPVFWALANSEKTTGLTAHLIEKKIDSGRILCAHEEAIQPCDTHHSLYRRIVISASPMVRNMLVRLLRTGSHPCYSQGKEGRNYVSFPTAEAMRRFRKAGRRFS